MNPLEEKYEAVSRDLNQFRERRLTDRRFKPRATVDRRRNLLPGTSQPGDNMPDPESGQETH